MNGIPEKQAEQSGYRPLTNSYQLPQERWMLDNVIADMERGGIDYVLVKQETGLEVWRRAPKSSKD